MSDPYPFYFFMLHSYNHDRIYPFDWKAHPHWKDCDCNLAETLKSLYPRFETESKLNEDQMIDDSPMHNLTREEFCELFNKRSLINAKFLRENPDEAIKLIIERRNKMMRAIAIIRTHVHADEDSLREYEKNASIVRKRAIREADKSYRPKPRIEDSGLNEKTGNKLIDNLIKQFGSKEKALEFLNSIGK